MPPNTLVGGCASLADFMENTTMATGTVKWFSDEKGFGFIVPDEGDGDLFVHRSSLDGVQILQEGQKVEYDVGEGRKGPEATQVRPA